MDTNAFTQLMDEKFQSLQSFFIETIKSDVLSEFKKAIDTITKEFSHSIEFLSAELKDATLKIVSASKEIENLKSENSILSLKVADLTSRVSSAEQNARECNIEIDCVPENRNEIVVDIVKKLATTVSVELKDDQIRSCYRVSKMNKESSRPRSIVVKLPSSRCRDDIIAAVKKFNKSSPSNKLNSTHLGIKGEKRQIYVSEHLSPLNKSLHAAARATAKDKNMQFCWVRNGQIFLRKNDATPAVLIKNIEMLTNL
ncbi:unnamed protein product [Plutella xylostella]|uniref:(diamondback moth) hypothetical protein n=1 Tax=Plutella xylostella TaxID=51655 RepID=A0A8S4DVM3_PLUXY|nr:unnamed protein product [Plutella xylostella]